MTENEMAEYHKIFEPEEDLFTLAGRSVFTELANSDDEEKKNAIVIPNYLLNGDDNDPEGLMDAFQDLEGSGYETRRVNGNLIYEHQSGVDVIVVPVDKKGIKEQFPNVEAISADPRVRIKKKLRGYENVNPPEFLFAASDIVDRGVIEGNAELSELLNSNNSVDLETAQNVLERELYNNQFVIFEGNNEPQYARVRMDIERGKDGLKVAGTSNERLEIILQREHGKRLSLGNDIRSNIFGIRPQDMEQYFAMQYGILSPNAEIVFISGTAGTGKTIITYPTAVDLILNYDEETAKMRGTPEGRNSFYDRMVLLKPNDPLGGKRRDAGTVPGDLFKKSKHLVSYELTHEQTELDGSIRFKDMFLHPSRPNDYGVQRESAEKNLREGMDVRFSGDYEAIKLISFADLRGVSLNNTLLVVDETQNYTPFEVKSIVTRLGPGSKAIFLGDPGQFDNPFCSKDFNGFTFAIRHYLERPNSLLMKLPTVYRSDIADHGDSMHAFRG